MDITIEKLIYGGEGLAHHDGATIFVPFVLPEERITATAVEQKKKFVRARVERLLQPSPQRTLPRCPHFGICGGCDYQHIPYEAQLQYKEIILRETLRRLGRIDWKGDITVHPSPPWGYRNRAQWKIRAEASAPNGAARDGAPMALGYLRAGSSALCAISECAVLSPLLTQTMLSLRSAVAAGALAGTLREIEAVADGNDENLLLTAIFATFPSRAAAEQIEALRKAAPEAKSILLQDATGERMELDGPGFITWTTDNASFRVGHFSFFQVNRFLAGELALHAADYPSAAQNDEHRNGSALDLFAGVGLFTLPLARRFDRVVAVESNPAAVRDLETNARAAANVEVRSSDVDAFLARYKGQPDLVLLDPPRAGLSPEAARHLVRISPATIAYVSCEPPTLARDLALLLQGGYEIGALHLFDLFPQTFHMETIVHLRRKR
jgi:23S rRNA (uracil1939-C5)-methyltransferase